MHQQLLARTVRGIEDVAADEIRALGATHLETGHREVRFVGAREHALRLRTVDDVFAVLVDAPPTGPHRADLRTLSALASGLDLGGAVDVTASFLGRRTYSRFEIEDAVVSALADRPGAPISLRVHLTPERTTIAARLAHEPLHRRAYRVVSRPGALHPPLAAALVRLAQPQPGATLLDPFCGTGTIAIEAKLARSDLRVLARDASAEAVRATAANARSARVELELAVRRAEDAEPVDAVVANPPWGRAYPLAIRWSPAGRAVMLLAAEVEPPHGLSVLDRRWVRVAGRPAVCWTVEPRR